MNWGRWKSIDIDAPVGKPVMVFVDMNDEQMKEAREKAEWLAELDSEWTSEQEGWE